MDYYEAVLAQGERLENSAQSVASALADTDLGPWRSGLLGVSAMGASSHAAIAFVDRLVRHGRRAVKLDASDLMSLGPDLDVADSFVFISESGRSRETIAAAKLAPSGRRLGITNNPAAPMAEVVDAVVGLGHGEDSKVYTVGYTATLQAFAMLATAIDGVDDGDDWAALPELMSTTHALLAKEAKAVAESLSELTSLDFVGDAASLASASEAALLFREATRTCTATYSTYQYLHGPMEPMTSRQGCFVFGDGREVALAQYLVSKQIPTVLVTSAETTAAAGLSVLHLPRLAPLSGAILEILAAQLVVGELARLRGLGIDGFRYHQDDTKIDSV
jgi:fructoselysine-6-P-deglycase FrlB-like protein